MKKCHQATCKVFGLPCVICKYILAPLSASSSHLAALLWGTIAALQDHEDDLLVVTVACVTFTKVNVTHAM